MTSARSKKNVQFSMGNLLAMITIACVVLTIPGGYVLLAMAVFWSLLCAAILKVMLIYRVPIYRLLAGKRFKERD